jgi:hypothetical protein
VPASSDSQTTRPEGSCRATTEAMAELFHPLGHSRRFATPQEPWREFNSSEPDMGIRSRGRDQLCSVTTRHTRPHLATCAHNGGAPSGLLTTPHATIHRCKERVIWGLRISTIREGNETACHASTMAARVHRHWCHPCIWRMNAKGRIPKHWSAKALVVRERASCGASSGTAPPVVGCFARTRPGPETVDIRKEGWSDTHLGLVGETRSPRRVSTNVEGGPRY